MATIDLIVLGIIKDHPISAYDIQKLVEFRNISKWVKISTPSIYKKVLQLEEKGLISGTTVKEGKMPEKEIYTLTNAGEQEFKKLMFEISAEPINFFLDFNAVIVNIDKLSKEQREKCINQIRNGIVEMKTALFENRIIKEKAINIPETGLAVLHQQYVLVEALETWLNSIL